MHISVLQKEILYYLDPKPNENFIDATLGLAGHTLEILKKNSPEGKVLGIDQDSESLKKIREELKDIKYKNRIIFVCDNFVNLKEIVKKEKFNKVSGILFDLGMSSWHLDKSGRGFSFLKMEPLDMRYEIKLENEFAETLFHLSPHLTLPGSVNEKLKILTAEKIINNWPEEDIEKILREYGEERFSKSIARKIVEIRKIKPIKTTNQLVEIIKRAVPNWYRFQRLHSATKTFQALRISVNNELEILKNVLPQALEILEKGGRLAVISFHSLEDRIIKNFLKEKNKENLIKILTKKPIMPSKEEIKINFRSRSAKLRVCQKV